MGCNNSKQRSTGILSLQDWYIEEARRSKANVDVNIEGVRGTLHEIYYDNVRMYSRMCENLSQMEPCPDLRNQFVAFYKGKTYAFRKIGDGMEAFTMEEAYAVAEGYGWELCYTAVLMVGRFHDTSIPAAKRF